MHGRVKVKTTAEQAEAKKKEIEEKFKAYVAGSKKIFEKRANKELDEEGLKLTGQFLERNPDFYTLWNFRREILFALKPLKTKEELQDLASAELTLTQNSLKTNHKSYGAWHHRFWAMAEFMPEPDWKKELKLCDYFLSLDERNFHCWDYRRLIAKKCEVNPTEELQFTTTLIEKNFSNYSAWHYRSTLLPAVHPGVTTGSVDETVLLKEFELVQNAAFTDPNDQSVWFYHRWLLGRSKLPIEVLNVTVMKHQNQVAVLLSESVKMDENCSMKIQINNVYYDVLWKPVDSCSRVSMIWVCKLPKDSPLEDGTHEVIVELKKDNETSSLACCLNGYDSFSWKKTSRVDAFRSELSAATKEVLERELESCQQLYEFEPDNKWTLFTSILLMRALNYPVFEEKIDKYMNQLIQVDALRKHYYRDLGSKFVIENIIETLPVEAQEVSIVNKNLSTLHHLEQLILIKRINLSKNCLTSIQPMCNLICIQSIILDGNQLVSCDGLQGLQHLEYLSLKNNYISDVSSLEALRECPRLQQLFLEGNPVAEDPEYFSVIASLRGLKLIDEKTL